jgi:uncharacterized protein (TIGR02678 family)
MVRSVLADEAATQRSRAIRALLALPLLDRIAGDDFTAVVVHADWLQRWFDDKCGWVLVVDGRHGYARLRKIPVAGDPRRGLLTNRASRRPFTRRRYALLCVVAAVLSDTSRPQISLRDLVGRVSAATANRPKLEPFAPARRDERVALVDAMDVLLGLGVLRLLESRGDFSSEESANALYDIDDRRLGEFIAAPQSPAVASSLAELMHEDRYGLRRSESGRPLSGEQPLSVQLPETWGIPALQRSLALAASGTATGTEEQVRRRVRHRIMRRLLDDPVLYLADLDEAERGYLQVTVASITTWVREAGMVLERRKEGWAAIDPDNIATDIRFPEGNDVVKHAALLLLAKLAPEDPPAGPAVRQPLRSAELILAERLRTRPSWARAYQDGGGAGRLTNAALEMLAGLGLIRFDPTGLELLPAAGRYRPRLTETPAAGRGEDQ